VADRRGDAVPAPVARSNVVMITSVAGVRPLGSSIADAMSKAALNHLTACSPGRADRCETDLRLLRPRDPQPVQDSPGGQDRNVPATPTRLNRRAVTSPSGCVVVLDELLQHRGEVAVGFQTRPRSSGRCRVSPSRSRSAPCGRVRAQPCTGAGLTRKAGVRGRSVHNRCR
jgi:hypothetical protein